MISSSRCQLGLLAICLTCMTSSAFIQTKSPISRRSHSLLKERCCAKLNMILTSSSYCACGVCSLCSPATTLLQHSLHNSLALSDAAISGATFETNLSLYFTLALYVLTLPGLYSLVTRSVKVKDTQKQYDLPGPANPTAKATRQIAGEVMAYFKALNYEITTAEDVITFRVYIYI